MSARKSDQMPVIYAQNQLVNLQFSYSKCQLDVLLYILYVFREGESVYSFNLSEINGVIGREWRKEDVERMGNKLSTSYFKYRQSDEDIEWYALFSSLKYHRGVLTVTINEDVLPFFSKTKSNYTKMELRSGLQLDSKYAKRLYMLLSEYKYSGEHEFGVDELKGLLQANGSTYDTFSRFRELVELCERQISERTDLCVRVAEWRKTSRRITSVVFSIAKKAEPDAREAGMAAERLEFVRVLCAHGFDEGQAERMCANGLTPGRFEEIKGRVLRQVRKGQVVDANGYLAQVLINEGFMRPREQRQMKTILAENGKKSFMRSRQAVIETISGSVAAGVPVESFAEVMERYSIGRDDLI